jgi:hypothetical protein
MMRFLMVDPSACGIGHFPCIGEIRCGGTVSAFWGGGTIKRPGRLIAKTGTA